MRITPAFIVVSILATTAACGSVKDEDGSGGGETAAGVTTGATTGLTTAVGVTASVGGTAVSTGSSNPTGEGPGSGGAGEGGVSTGEGGGVGSGASGPVGSGGEGPGTGGSSGTGSSFLCGEVECEDDEQCCASQQGALTCIGANEDCGGATLNCQNASNCEGDQICCVQGEIGTLESVCTDACEPTQLGPLQLCETAEECVEDVPCMEIFGGFKACSDGFPGGPGGP